MKIRIGNFEFTECWDGVLYKKLSEYPKISPWEIQNILDFIRYERMYGRECAIEASEEILRAIEDYRTVYGSGIRVSPPEKITECTACPVYKGCLTAFVCHTASAENAVKILEEGKLLSAVKARGIPAGELAKEKRNAANDPEDYFHYVMFSWGNCQAGDRLVMERKLGRFPSEEDLSTGFTPGVRFFFRYEDLLSHPDAITDGVLPVKIKDEVVLKDWVHSVILPEELRSLTESHIPEELSSRVHYLVNDTKDIWEWSQKVYEYVRQLPFPVKL